MATSKEQLTSLPFVNQLNAIYNYHGPARHT